MLCYFLLYSKGNQPYVYIHPLIFLDFLPIFDSKYFQTHRTRGKDPELGESKDGVEKASWGKGILAKALVYEQELGRQASKRKSRRRSELTDVWRPSPSSLEWGSESIFGIWAQSRP